MTCQVIIQDCVINRRMTYLLNDADFGFQQRQSGGRIPVPLFSGKFYWSDLDVPQYRSLIASGLDILAAKTDAERGDPANLSVLNLTFYLCGLVAVLQKSHSCIELLRITRLTPSDLLYGYTASLEVNSVT